LTGPESDTVNGSFASIKVSPLTSTVIVLVVCPGLNVSDPVCELVALGCPRVAPACSGATRFVAAAR
jgi:hypothetical protein